MEIDTSSKQAARRNLVTLAVGFHLFVLGEAQIGDGSGLTTITILAGSITFNNPSMLAIFSWVMLIWFLIRFWQFNDHGADWLDYTRAMYQSNLMSKWMALDGFRKGKYDGGEIQKIFEDWQWSAVSDKQNRDLYYIRKIAIFRKLCLFLYVALKTEKFGQYYFPYLIAFSAMYLASGNS